MQFLDRQRELQALDSFLNTSGAGLLILFGRRRVGKTRLLTHFVESRHFQEGMYWTATTHGAGFQLRDFSGAVMRYAARFGAPVLPDFAFPDWEAALAYLAEVAARASSPQLIVLDEFTYLNRSQPATTSIFQKQWDHQLSRCANLKLVLTGSLVGMMERGVISYQAPLYGRATALLRLRPLPYAAIRELFPDRQPAERVAIYAVSGGIPAYLELFTRAGSFSTALLEQCLGPGSIMLTDPSLILHEQLQEPQTFESILSAIASGFHAWSEIARMAAVPESNLGHYLKILQELEIIERRDPIFAATGGRQGQYHIRDHFLRFYYRFIVPHITAIERGYLQGAVDQITVDLRAFIGSYVFEELCREWVFAAASLGQLGFQPDTVSAYWRRGSEVGVHLDVVAANRRERRLLIGEAKWGEGEISRKVLTDLIKRSQRMPQVTEGWAVSYVLFGREGFSDASRALAEELGVRLVALPELEQTLSVANR